MKNQYRGGDCLEREGGLDSLLIEGVPGKRRVVFWGGLIPQCTLIPLAPPF